eukprot:gene8189-biopygen1566
MWDQAECRVPLKAGVLNGDVGGTAADPVGGERNPRRPGKTGVTGAITRIAEIPVLFCAFAGRSGSIVHGDGRVQGSVPTPRVGRARAAPFLPPAPVAPGRGSQATPAPKPSPPKQKVQ